MGGGSDFHSCGIKCMGDRGVRMTCWRRRIDDGEGGREGGREGGTEGGEGGTEGM